MVDVYTGEVKNPKGKTERHKIEKRNEKNTKMIKSIQKNLNVSGKQLRKIIENIPMARDISIENFYQSIERFIPPLQDFIKARMDELLGDNSPERREAVAKVLRENPDYIPTPEDSQASTIAYKFSELNRILQLELDEQQKLQQLAETDGVEYEDEYDY